MLGLELLTSAFGVLTCIRGLSAFMGPPLGGFVIDATSPEKIANMTGRIFRQSTLDIIIVNEIFSRSCGC